MILSCHSVKKFGIKCRHQETNISEVCGVDPGPSGRLVLSDTGGSGGHPESDPFRQPGSPC